VASDNRMAQSSSSLLVANAPDHTAANSTKL